MRIGLIAPSGCYSKEKLKESRLFIEKKGHQTICIGPHGRNHGYFSAKDDERNLSLTEAIERDDLDLIWIIRGGYGATRLLPSLLDFKERIFPKQWIGFSDATAIFPILHKMGAGTFLYGPNFIEVCDKRAFDRKSLFSFLGNENELQIKLKQNQIKNGKSFSGTLVGGCLTLLVNLIGTGCEPEYDNTILLLEEVNEAPYRIDRLLTHLKNSGLLSRVKAVLLGDFSSCSARDKNGLSLSQVFGEILLPLDIPVIKGLKIGHCNNKITVPLFGKVSLNYSEKAVTFANNTKLF